VHRASRAAHRPAAHPRVHRSRGIVASLWRSARLPGQLLREYRVARSLPRNLPRSAFDTEHGVDTDGELGGWTYLSDLEIESPNWIHGVNYTAIEPERFAAVMAGMALRHEDFVFVDFGSGKGRALLLASEFPFRRVIGFEFAPELHAIATENLRKYRRAPKDAAPSNRSAPTSVMPRCRSSRLCCFSTTPALRRCCPECSTR
jgi:hypothetical protein